jgi:signal transduction histidine kinase
MRRRARRPPGLRFILGTLAVGALALPFAIAGSVALFLSARGAEQPFMHYRELSLELEKATRIGPGGELSAVPGYRPESGFQLVLADKDGLVAYSSSPRFAKGSIADLPSIALAAKEDFASPSFFSEILSLKGRVIGSYYAWLPMAKAPGRTDFSAPTAGSLALVGLLVAVFLLGVLVATVLARGVVQLERAAGMIAAGDFDTAVSVRGIREIEDLARAMDTMRATLREERDQRARFLAAVSHDLRTPLTSIGGYLEAVEDGLASSPETLERYVRIMRGKTRLLETRIGGLIDFARMETEEWRMGFEEVELRAFLEGYCREAREDALLLGRRLESDLEALEGLRWPIDRILLARAFENVVTNALRFSPPGGLVSLVARALPEGMRVEVDDEGPGIPSQERERVFEPFFRGSSAGEEGARGEGSGLGLYIARSIVRGHGWDLAAGESPSGGGRISFIIPNREVP